MEFLVFMYVNRFQKLHSKIFSACNYSAFFLLLLFCLFVFSSFFFFFSVFLMNVPLFA